MMILRLGALPDAVEPNGLPTDELGKILEAEYGLFSRFFESNEQFIVDNLTNSLQGYMESVFQGGHPHDPFDDATSEIDKRFRDFLDSEEMASLGVPGVPTKAALAGRSKRRKKPYAKGPRRPSFIDSGILQTSFKSEVIET